MQINEYVSEFIPKTIIDGTTDPDFLFISDSLDPDQATTGTKWRTYRVNQTGTDAGTLLFAKFGGVASNKFVFQASNAASETF